MFPEIHWFPFGVPSTRVFATVRALCYCAGIFADKSAVSIAVYEMLEDCTDSLVDESSQTRRIQPVDAQFDSLFREHLTVSAYEKATS